MEHADELGQRSLQMRDVIAKERQMVQEKFLELSSTHPEARSRLEAQKAQHAEVVSDNETLKEENALLRRHLADRESLLRIMQMRSPADSPQERHVRTVTVERGEARPGIYAQRQARHGGGRA